MQVRLEKLRIQRMSRKDDDSGSRLSIGPPSQCGGWQTDHCQTIPECVDAVALGLSGPIPQQLHELPITRGSSIPLQEVLFVPFALAAPGTSIFR